MSVRRRRSSALQERPGRRPSGLPRSRGCSIRDPAAEDSHDRQLLENLPTILSGLEDLTFEFTTVPPPPNIAQECCPTHQPATKKAFPQMIPPSEEDVRDALAELTTFHCSCVDRTAKDLTIASIDPCPGYRYTLESFTEMRQVCWHFEPYSGDALDEPSAGPAPDPWSIECSCPVFYQNSSVTLDIAHTDHLRSCHICGGVGRRKCLICNASGWEQCLHCHGVGNKMSLQGSRDRCHCCLGTGTKRCWYCDGKGFAACRGCTGTGQIRCFVALTVTWSNHLEEQVKEPTDVIKEKLQSATGQVILEEEGSQVSPISDFPEKSLSEISSEFLEKHKNTFYPSERLILQRQRVEMIPVSIVTYQWKQRSGEYFVYGLENTAYAPDYKETPCCILL